MTRPIEQFPDKYYSLSHIGSDEKVHAKQGSKQSWGATHRPAHNNTAYLGEAWASIMHQAIIYWHREVGSLRLVTDRFWTIPAGCATRAVVAANTETLANCVFFCTLISQVTPPCSKGPTKSCNTGTLYCTILWYSPRTQRRNSTSSSTPGYPLHGQCI